MKKKIIKRTLLVLLWTVIIIGVCIFPYPALFMANSIPKQPELSLHEKLFFDSLKKEQPWSKIRRMYSNIDSLGNEIWIHDIPINFNSQYVYCICLATQDSTFYSANCTRESALALAKHIKDRICLNSMHLFGIEVDIKYIDTNENSGKGMYELYQFYIKEDSIKFKKKMNLILWEEEKE